MQVIATAIDDVKIIEPSVFGDERGLLMELWHERKFGEAGIDAVFVQDNYSESRRHTLRGLHYQIRQPQGKLLQVLHGEIFDVVVDLRASSPTFGQWVSTTLSAQNHRQFWVPPGFAHGFYVCSERAAVLYKCTDFYAPEHARVLAWDAPELAITWPILDGIEPVLSAQDRRGWRLEDAETFG